MIEKKLGLVHPS